ncbi:MAG: site-specific integrase [Lachnospiraceae bacterium]|nr:site-specific integrase [Lachnospiraceae bacterium]
MQKTHDLPRGITLRKDGRYQASYYFNGTRKYLYDMNLDALEVKLRNVRYEIDHGIFTKPERIRLDDWFSTWMNEYKAFELKKGTIENYKRNYRLYISPYLGNCYVKEIRAEHLQKLYNDLMRAGYSYGVINLCAGILSGMFTQLMRNDIIMKNPVKLANLPKKEKRPKRRVLTDSEQQLFLKYAASSNFYSLYRLALATGLRIGELTSLTWKDIDFENESLSVTGTLKYFKDTGFYKDSPKSESGNRTVPLLPSICKMLKHVRREQNKDRLSSGAKWKPVKGLEHLVFTTKNGEPLKKRTIAYDIDHITDEINENEKDIPHFEKFSPHTLRHTFATRALENGIPPKVVQDILGHSSITMTLDLYTHVLPKTKSTEILKIANLF